MLAKQGAKAARSQGYVAINRRFHVERGSGRLEVQVVLPAVTQRSITRYSPPNNNPQGLVERSPDI